MTAFIGWLPNSDGSRPSDKGRGGGGGGHPDPRIRGRAVSKIFSVLRASVWAKIGGGKAGSPVPLP